MVSGKKPPRSPSILDELKFQSRMEDTFKFEQRNGLENQILAFHFVNSYSLALASKSGKYLRVLKDGILFCDGKPLSRYLRFSRQQPLTQVRGADFLRNSISQMKSGVKHFFLGSTEEVLSALVAKAMEQNPNIEIVGAHAPEFFTDFEPYLDEWINLIRNSNSTCVWVGLGTPKQDFIANAIASRLNIEVYAVGAAFGYVSGTDMESPEILKRIYLEWLYRLFKEPRRLFTRYLWGNVVFLKIVLRDLFMRLILK